MPCSYPAIELVGLPPELFPRKLVGGILGEPAFDNPHFLPDHNEAVARLCPVERFMQTADQPPLSVESKHSWRICLGGPEWNQEPPVPDGAGRPSCSRPDGCYITLVKFSGRSGWLSSKWRCLIRLPVPDEVQQCPTADP
jgi:hypothetical protein